MDTRICFRSAVPLAAAGLLALALLVVSGCSSGAGPSASPSSASNGKALEGRVWKASAISGVATVLAGKGTEVTAEFAAGASVLLHEAWYNGADPLTDASARALRPGYAAHSEATAVARIAVDAGVGRLVLMHLNPLHDDAYHQRMAATARAGFARTELHPDGAVLDTGAAV